MFSLVPSIKESSLHDPAIYCLSENRLFIRSYTLTSAYYYNTTRVLLLRVDINKIPDTYVHVSNISQISNKGNVLLKIKKRILISLADMDIIESYLS